MGAAFKVVPRPQLSGEKNDCVVRAYANALGLSYAEAHERATLAGRKRERRTGWAAVHALYATFGIVEVVGERIDTFARANPVGTFIVGIRGHVFAMRDGICIDMQEPVWRKAVTHAWIVNAARAEPLPEAPAVHRAIPPPFDLRRLLNGVNSVRIVQGAELEV